MRLFILKFAIIVVAYYAALSDNEELLERLSDWVKRNMK